MADTYRIDLVNSLSPDVIYAERQKRKDEADWQNLLGGPQGAQPGEGSLGAPPEKEKPSALKTADETTVKAMNANAALVLDGLTEVLTLGTKPGSGNPMQTMTKLVQGLVGFGLSPFVGAGAGARQALENEAPEIAQTP